MKLRWCIPFVVTAMFCAGILLGEFGNAQQTLLQSGSGGGTPAATTCTAGNQATNFLTRTSGLDAAHNKQYCFLINGLVADGTFGLFDIIYVFATNGTNNSLLNLISSSFTASAVNTPAFSTDHGYSGTDANNSANYITTSAALNSLTQFTQNSAHMSAWVLTNIATTTGGAVMGADGGNSSSDLFDTFSDGNVYGRINDNPTSGAQGAPGTRVGYWIITRSSSTVSTLYQNGLLFSSPNGTGTTVTGNTAVVLANGVAALGSPNQVGVATFGAALNSAQASSVYARFHAYMQNIAGVP